MTLAIRVTGLGKRYRLIRDLSRPSAAARQPRPPQSLVEEISRVGASFARRLRGLPSGSGSEDFWALREVGFEIPRGEVVGIIGRNGSGKSTLLKILSRVTEPTEGRVHLNGRVASLLEVGTGFHPDLSVRQNIFLNGAILGMRRKEISARLDQIVEFAGVEQFFAEPVKHLSSGMYMRLAFAVAAFLESEILIVDEVLAVGDAAFQEKSLGTMRDAVRSGRTVLFVSHNMTAISQLTQRALVLDSGRVAFDGPTPAAVQFYLHERRQQKLAGRQPTDQISCIRRYRGRGDVLIREMGLGPGQTDEIPPGGSVRLEFLVEAAQPTSNLRILYSINSATAEPLITGISPTFSCPSGAHLFELTISNLDLIPGAYDFTVGLGQGTWAEVKLEYDAYVGFGHLRISDLRADGRVFGSWLPGWAPVFHNSADIRRVADQAPN